MNNMQKLLSACLAAVLACSMVPCAVAAEVATAKDEVVYARLDAAGALQSVYVVNSFEATDVTDFGDYSSVKALNFTEPLASADGVVAFSTSVGKSYYQGELEGAQLPWTISIRYVLDGVEVSASELAGASGALEILFDVSQNEACEGNFYDAFALQANFTLSTELCANIEAADATVANAGSNKQISFTILPGSGISTSITADVVDFEMDAVEINGVRMNLDVDFDDAELMDEIAELAAAIAQLDSGADELDSGASAIGSGASSLEEGASSLADGVAALAAGLAELEEGLAELSGNSEALTTGSAQFAAALEQLQAQVAQLAAAYPVLASLQTAVDTLAEQYATLDAGIASYTAGADSAAEGAAALSEGASAASEGAEALQEALATLVFSLNELSGGASTLSTGTATLAAETAGLDDEVSEKIDTVLTSITAADEEVASFVDPNNNANSVQFVLKTTAIEIPEVQVEETETAPLTLWQKLLHLFGLA